MSINEAIEFGKKINAQAIHPNFKLLNDKTVKKLKIMVLKFILDR